MKTITALAFFLASISPIASAQMGEGRLPVRLGGSFGVNQSSETFRAVGGGGSSHSMVWVEEDDFSSTESVFINTVSSVDAGLTWNTDQIYWSQGEPMGSHADNFQVEEDRDELFIGYTVSDPNPIPYIWSLKRGSLFRGDSRQTMAGFGVSHGDLAAFTHASRSQTLDVHLSTDNAVSWHPADELSVAGALSGLHRPIVSALVENGQFFIAWTVVGPSGNRELYFSQAAGPGGWSYPVQLDQSASRVSRVIPETVVLKSTDSGLAISYSDVPLAGGNLQNHVLSSLDYGITWNELTLDSGGLETREFTLIANEDDVATAWIARNAGLESIEIAVSHDRGITFPFRHSIPNFPASRASRLRDLGFSFDGNRVIVGAFSNSDTGNESRYRPYYAVSIDSGENWGELTALTAVGTPEPVGDWSFGNSHLIAYAYQPFRGRTWAAGIRFPTIHAQTSGNGTLGLHMANIAVDPALPSFARWAVSTHLGSSPHPDLPGFNLDLARSSAFDFSLNHQEKFGSRVHVDGTANCIVHLPPGLTGTYYMQGWVNTGGVSGVGGSRPSDVIRIDL